MVGSARRNKRKLGRILEVGAEIGVNQWENWPSRFVVHRRRRCVIGFICLLLRGKANISSIYALLCGGFANIESEFGFTHTI